MFAGNVPKLCPSLVVDLRIVGNIPQSESQLMDAVEEATCWRASFPLFSCVLVNSVIDLWETFPSMVFF